MQDAVKKEGWLLKLFAEHFCKSALIFTVLLYFSSSVASLFVPRLGSMSLICVVGSFWLGALVGLSLGFYVQEEKAWDKRAFIASLSPVSGAGVIVLFHHLAQNIANSEYWFYPIGLVYGFIIGTLWHHADPPKREN
jgi:hypothetical protein